MNNHDMLQKWDPFVKWVLLGIPVLFIAAVPIHFLFEWTGEKIFVGLLTPVNESPWEHLKLAFLPILIWWIIGYFLYSKKHENSLPRCAVSCVVAEIVCNLFIIAFYYTYTGALGIESLILDMLSLLLGLFFGFLLAVHIYKYSKPSAFVTCISVVIILIMAAAFILFTFMPLHIPLFKDLPTGTYGI